jgi:hypothetical protein
MMAAPQHAKARPDSTIYIGPSIKLHRRTVISRGRPYTVLTLRPGTRARFSTNFFHQTWHLLSDGTGAGLLARLLWGLSYQARPGTLILLDHPHLDPNPFDAGPPRPIALLPYPLTGFDADLLGAVHREVRCHPNRSEGTVRWQTAGLDRELARQARFEADRVPGSPRSRWPRWLEPGRPRPIERVAQVGGVVTVAANPAGLRSLAVDSAELAQWWYGGQASRAIGDYDGEVQIWREYHRMVAIARTARAEVLADPDTARLGPDDLAPLVWRRGAQLRRQRYGPREPADAAVS